jgi:hypothetical protein
MMAAVTCQLWLKSDTKQTCSILIANDTEGKKLWGLAPSVQRTLRLNVWGGQVDWSVQRLLLYDDKPFRSTTFGIRLEGVPIDFLTRYICKPRAAALVGEGTVVEDGNTRAVGYAISAATVCGLV